MNVLSLLSGKIAILLLVVSLSIVDGFAEVAHPNILFAISDDQSYPYASAYGTEGIDTPAFDRLAREGVLFHNAFAPAPQCSPCRAAILTGKNIWQLEEAGTHASYFPKKFQVFTRALEEIDYHVGYTGKPWRPGNYEDSGWNRNPVGDEYNDHEVSEKPASGILNLDYTRNFEAFLDKRDSKQPFFFWYGAQEPHRGFEYGSGKRLGKKLEDAEVPAFLPSDDIVKNDVMDYAVEIEWFDWHLGKMVRILEEKGELENTIIVVTSDNGMAFPYAKANAQEYGTHVPLVIAAPAFFAGNRQTWTPVSLIDLTPTFLELAQCKALEGMVGKSLVPFLTRGEDHRGWVLTGRERHTHARPDNLGYPVRAIRTREFLYVWNMKPDRWPMGNPPPEGVDEAHLTGAFSEDFQPMGLGYADVDRSPSKQFLVENRETFPDLFQLSFGFRPEVQLYDVRNDPWCLNDLARNPNYRLIRDNLRQLLRENLLKQGDPRMMGSGDIFESYPRFSRMRWFPGFKEPGEYNPAFQK